MARNVFYRFPNEEKRDLLFGLYESHTNAVLPRASDCSAHTNALGIRYRYEWIHFSGELENLHL